MAKYDNHDFTALVRRFTRIETANNKFLVTGIDEYAPSYR